MSNGWGQLTWGEGLWGQQGDQIVALSGLNLTLSLGGFTQTNIRYVYNSVSCIYC